MAQRYTKAQLAWRPGMPKPRRSTRVLFMSTTLALQALAVIFAGLAMFGLNGRLDGGVPVLVACLVLAAVMIADCAFLSRTWGVQVGWVLQVITILLGILQPAMYVVGALFLIIWAYSVIKGGSIDRENAERDRAQAAWEAEHPEDENPEHGSAGQHG